MSPPKVRFLTKLYHPNIGALPPSFLPCTFHPLTNPPCETNRQARSHLPRHPQGQVVPRSPDPNRAPLGAGVAQRSQPRACTCFLPPDATPRLTFAPPG